MTTETDDDAPDGACESCGEFMSADELNVEAFELTGQVLCQDCAGAAMEKAAGLTW